jgi:hypothetical protein
MVKKKRVKLLRLMGHVPKQKSVTDRDEIEEMAVHTVSGDALNYKDNKK